MSLMMKNIIRPESNSQLIMVKKRSLNQKYSQKSAGKLFSLLSDWIVNPLPNDFGFDFDIRVCGEFKDKIQEVGNLSFYAQLKSTSDPCVSHSFHDITGGDLNLYVNQGIPVVILKYYEKCDKLYWVIIQPYVWDELSKEDANWFKKATKRIKLSKILNNPKILEQDLIAAQKRIARHQVLNLGIGEGLNLNEMGIYREKSLKEYRLSSLVLASEKVREGEIDKAESFLEDIIATPGDDEYILNAILNLIFQFNSLNIVNHKKILNLTEKGIELSNKLNALNFVHLFKILRYQTLLVKIISQLFEVLYLEKYDRTYGEDLFWFFYQSRAISLNSEHQNIIKLINQSLIELVRGGHKLELTISLSVLIEAITHQIQALWTIDPEIIQFEEKNRAPLIAAFTDLLKNETNLENLQFYFYKFESILLLVWKTRFKLQNTSN